MNLKKDALILPALSQGHEVFFSLVRCFGSADSLNGTPLGGAEDLAVAGESGLPKAHKLLFSSGCTGWQEAAIFFIVRDLRDVLT